jgi:plastocyanin
MPVGKIFPLMLLIAALASCQMTSSGAGMGTGAGTGTGMGSSGGSTGALSISGFTFQPTPDTIAGGVSLTWTNLDGVTHTVTTDTGVTPAFDSGAMGPGTSYSLTLTLPGTYAYHCSIHTGMKGTIVVQ